MTAQCLRLHSLASPTEQTSFGHAIHPTSYLAIHTHHSWYLCGSTRTRVITETDDRSWRPHMWSERISWIGATLVAERPLFSAGCCITEAHCLGSYMCSWLSFFTRQNHVKIHIFHWLPWFSPFQNEFFKLIYLTLLDPNPSLPILPFLCINQHTLFLEFEPHLHDLTFL
jgi:hypothetical protein